MLLHQDVNIFPPLPICQFFSLYFSFVKWSRENERKINTLERENSALPKLIFIVIKNVNFEVHDLFSCCYDFFLSVLNY